MSDQKSKVAAPAPLNLPDVLVENELRLYEGVLAALRALPASFSFPHPVSGIRVTDLFNLNSLIGAAIEDQVVVTLNRTRSIWDPDHEWDDCMFVRRSQSFPDVRLIRRGLFGAENVMGIELKGWCTLSKEGVPSFRYQVAKDACAKMDLLCVVPWYLDNAVSGEAKVLEPWIEQARYAAEWRDYWWEYRRKGSDSSELRKIVQPDNVSPYPLKSEIAHAVPVKDSGGNFGRLPRCKPLMSEFIDRALDEQVLGVSLRDWVNFISLHTDNPDSAKNTEALLRHVEEKALLKSEENAEEVIGLLKALANKLDLD